MVQALPSNIGIQQVTLKVADLDKIHVFFFASWRFNGTNDHLCT
jgi:hypothetical protein